MKCNKFHHFLSYKDVQSVCWSPNAFSVGKGMCLQYAVYIVVSQYWLCVYMLMRKILNKLRCFQNKYYDVCKRLSSVMNFPFQWKDYYFLKRDYQNINKMWFLVDPRSNRLHHKLNIRSHHTRASNEFRIGVAIIYPFKVQQSVIFVIILDSTN